jgi:Ca2+-binding EF-hand superfamily protein
MTKSDILKEEMLLRVFQRLDYAGTGKLKIDEFALLFESFNIKVPTCDLYAMFNLADKD